MDKHRSSDSNFSNDSLDEEFKRKTSMKDGILDDNIESILVPFYDKDVLIRVPKDQKSQKKHDNGNKCGKYIEKQKQGSSQKSYLVNKDRKNSRCNSYLEMFRKQFSPNYKESKVMNDEIRSLSPEVGDTERESIGEVPNNLVTEFFNTESYNEMFYEKLVNRDYEQYFDNSLEELKVTEDIRSKLPIEVTDNNLRSVSEVSQSRRRSRRATVDPTPNVKLGGLGPDVEKIKPSLERARSLQRYSEKVRMENRVKIYKKSIQTDNENKNEKESSAKQRYSAKYPNRTQENRRNSTYLMNKIVQEQTPKFMSTINFYKSKSANVQRIKERAFEKVQHLRPASKKREASISKQHVKNLVYVENEKDKADCEENLKLSAKSGARSKNINTAKGNSTDIPPVHISFMVNVGGARPSSDLKTLEEKHRMYQEQIRAFNRDQNII